MKAWEVIFDNRIITPLNLQFFVEGDKRMSDIFSFLIILYVKFLLNYNFFIIPSLCLSGNCFKHKKNYSHTSWHIYVIRCIFVRSRSLLVTLVNWANSYKKKDINKVNINSEKINYVIVFSPALCSHEPYLLWLMWLKLIHTKKGHK